MCCSPGVTALENSVNAETAGPLYTLTEGALRLDNGHARHAFVRMAINVILYTLDRTFRTYEEGKFVAPCPGLRSPMNLMSFLPAANPKNFAVCHFT